MPEREARRVPSRCSAIVLAGVLLLAMSGGAPAVAATAGMVAAGRVVLPGSLHPLALPALEVGRTNPRLRLERIVVALTPRPGGLERRTRLLAELQDPASPRYHRWLTPEEYAAEVGIGDADLVAVVAWLRAQGLEVGPVARGRGWVEVSGTVAAVEAAFGIEMHDYRVAGDAGVVHHANSVVPSVPRALAGLVQGVVSLHDFPLLSASPHRGVAPQYDGPGDTHLLVPADVATIYGLASLYAAGIDGRGQAIAVVGRTDIDVADVQAFRSMFGLPANDPMLVHNGPDPGKPNIYDQEESSLDVEWAGAAAPGASVRLVISGSTGVSDGITLSAQYAVDQNVAPVVSLSYGACEATLGANTVAFWDALWAQAAAQGISVLAASGDSGPATCDPPTSPHPTRVSVNGLCSSPNDVCVGGTDLDDTANPVSYWQPVDDPVTQGSAIQYSPEIAWNESGTVPGGANLWSSGGGRSAVFAKPSWQAAPGVPGDGARDVPDVALVAASHTPYRYRAAQTMLSIGGTSVSAPIWAGIVALIDQRTRGRQGNPNPDLYKLGSRQYGGQVSGLFHDVTSGNNDIPGLLGYPAGAGYDLVTGLGSPAAYALVNAWPGTANPFCLRSPQTLCIDQQDGDGRFSISASFANDGVADVPATAIQLSSVGVSEGGLFWFFGAANPEILVKVIDACAVNQKLWVFSAANTNVAFTLQVLDGFTGRTRTYENPPGTAALPVQDTAAFDCP
jgi:subtilase family serine protease